MKKVKFRAWDKKHNEMIYPDGIRFNTGRGFDYSLDVGSKSYKDYILMQCIGLKDSSDTEIYEGDILRVGAEYSDIYKEFFCIKYLQYEAAYALHRISNGTVLNNVYFFDKGVLLHHKLEVIGNIYENPKLLEVQK